MLRKKLLFWLTWLLLGPLAMLYFCFMALFTGRFRSIGLKTTLVRQAVWQNKVQQKPVKRLTVDRYGKKRF